MIQFFFINNSKDSLSSFDNTGKLAP